MSNNYNNVRLGFKAKRYYPKLWRNKGYLCKQSIDMRILGENGIQCIINIRNSWSRGLRNQKVRKDKLGLKSDQKWVTFPSQGATFKAISAILQPWPLISLTGTSAGLILINFPIILWYFM